MKPHREDDGIMAAGQTPARGESEYRGKWDLATREGNNPESQRVARRICTQRCTVLGEEYEVGDSMPYPAYRRMKKLQDIFGPE